MLADGQATFSYGLGRIAQHGPASAHYFLGDALASVRQLTDQARQLTLAQAYEPFGDPLLAAGQDGTPYGFTGEWTDDTGLVHLRARYYDPTTGAFLSPDPWRGDPSEPASLAPYSYARANPIHLTDPSGQCYGPVEFLRKVPIESGICNMLDQAMFIYAWPGSSPADRNLAATYIGLWAFGHSALIVGAAGLTLAGGASLASWLYAQYLLSSLAPLVAKACGLAYAAWQATRGLAQRVSSPWSLPPLERGKAIEQLLHSFGLGRNLASNFPKIDRFVNGVAGSIKSIDLRLPTYQNMAALASRIQGYINDVANFQGHGIVRGAEIIGRELILAYPAGAGTPEQWSVLNRMYAIALEAGVILKTVPIP